MAGSEVSVERCAKTDIVLGKMNIIIESQHIVLCLSLALNGVSATFVDTVECSDHAEGIPKPCKDEYYL